MWVSDKTGSVRERLLKICKIKLGQASNQECPRIIWEEAKTLQNETGSSYKKHEVWDCVKCFTNPIEQRSLEISSIRVVRKRKKVRM
jgi:hypothetical protein